MFKIGDFSRLSRVSVRMLRYYDENDLFKPEVVDDFTGYRYYSARQIPHLNAIITLRDYGFSVLEMGEFLSTNKERQKEMLQSKWQQTMETIEFEKAKLAKIDSSIENLFKEKVYMNYKVEIKKVPSFKVVSLRDVIGAYNQEGILWQRLGEFMGKKGLNQSGLCYATYYDEECKESNVDVEVVMEVDELGKDEGEFTFKETEALDKAVSILIPGSYSNIADGFAYLGKWIEDNDYEIKGAMRQVPIKGPWNEEDEKDYLTEIQCPVK